MRISKVIVIVIVVIIPILSICAQNKVVPKKKNLDELMNEKVKLDQREGKVIPEKDLDYAMLQYSIGFKSLESLQYTLNEENAQRVLDNFNKAIANGFINALVYFQRGCCQYALHRYSAANVDYSRALDLNSSIGANVFPIPAHYEDSDEGWIYRGEGGLTFESLPSKAYFYRGSSKMELEDYRGAISDFRSASRYTVEKSNKQLFLMMGFCKMQLKDYSGAKIVFNQMIEADSNIPEAYYYRGGCDYNLGLKESACRDWSKAGELGYMQAYEDIKEFCN